MLSSFSSILAVAAAFVGLAAADCTTAEYGHCGSSSTGITCCPIDFYCQPWDVTYYQCMPVPAKCPNQQIDTGFGGSNLTTFNNLRTSDECCQQCTETTGCVGYTFVNDNPGNPACFLKSAVTASFSFTGAVSAMLSSATVTMAVPAEPVVVANSSASSSADDDVGSSMSFHSSASGGVDVEISTSTASSNVNVPVVTSSSTSGLDVDTGNSTSSDLSDEVAGKADSVDDGSSVALDASMSDNDSDDQETEN